MKKRKSSKAQSQQVGDNDPTSCHDEEKLSEYSKRISPLLGALRQFFPKATIGAVGGQLGGTLFYAYYPPTEETVRRKLTNRFGDLTTPEAVDRVVSKVLPKVSSSHTTDRSDLVSRVREKINGECLKEVETEFLAEFFEQARNLRKRLSETQDMREVSKILDLTEFLDDDPSPPDVHLFDDHHRHSARHKVKRVLKAGILTKQVTPSKSGPPAESLPSELEEMIVTAITSLPVTRRGYASVAEKINELYHPAKKFTKDSLKAKVKRAELDFALLKEGAGSIYQPDPQFFSESVEAED